MSLELVKSQNIAQYASLLSNPQFLTAVKSATKNDKSETYNSLLENLEKLNSSIEESNKSSKTTQTESGESLSLLKSIDIQQNSNSANVTNQQNAAVDQSMKQTIDDLIAKADLLESMLDLEISVPEDDVTDLLATFRKIITQLDQDLRKIQTDVKNKKTKEEFKLTPSSSTKSGFNESISFLAK